MKQNFLLKKFLCLLLSAVLCCNLSACSLYSRFVADTGNGVPEIFGHMIVEIQTDSMSPTFSPGDRIILEEVEPEDLKMGDIITYWTIIQGERVLNTHRIVEIYDGGGYLLFETKGDYNTTSDSLTTHEKEVVGKYVRKAILGWF